MSNSPTGAGLQEYFNELKAKVLNSNRLASTLLVCAHVCVCVCGYRDNSPTGSGCRCIVVTAVVGA